MSSITSGVGLFSGVNTQQLINQLLQVEGRQRNVFQRRIAQLQQRQAAYLDLNSRINGLKTAAAKFASSNIFGSAAATSSNADVLTATAATGAASGTYQFVVDRLVSTQQLLSAGYAQSTGAGVGLTKMTLESTEARLDRDTALAGLNGGLGIQRGKIRITDGTGASAVVDLSRVETVGEVLSAINGALGISVKARTDGDRLVVERVGGSGAITIAEVEGRSTAATLGILGTDAGGTITGTRINTVGERTALSALNDGLGVQISNAGGTATPDFKITTRSGESFDIDIGDMYEMQTPPGATEATLVKVKSAVTDVGGVIQRINEQARAAGVQKVRAQLRADGLGIELVDLSTPSGGSPALTVEDLGGRNTARDLGIAGTTATDTLSGRRLLAGLNSTLLRNILGGRGTTDGSLLQIVTADGSGYAADLATIANGSITDLQTLVSTATEGKVNVTLSENGTGLVFTDTSVGAGALDITGFGADALGITNASGGKVARTGNLERQYIGLATPVSRLNNGRGIGTGGFDIINGYGKRFTVNIGSSVQTVGEVISQINSVENVRARLNDTGDGIIVEALEANGVPLSTKLEIRERSGGVARALNLVGTAADVGAAQNWVNGRQERTITFSAADSLTEVASKINASGADVLAAVVNDGNPTRPFRLSLASKTTGLNGAFIWTTEGSDPGLSMISAAQNARVFFGSSDPASALLFSSSSNTVAGVAANLTVDAKTVSSTPVTVSVSRDTAAIQKAVEEFVKAFNSLIDRIDSQSKFDTETNKGGVLLGDSVSQGVRRAVFDTITGPALGVSGRFRNAAEVGLTAGRDGKLELNANKLSQALTLDPQAVADLLSAKVQAATSNDPVPVPNTGGGVFVRQTTTGQFTSQGIFERIAAAADQYIRPVDGFLTRQTRTIDDQIKSQNDRITRINEALERKRARLQSQFIAMEKAIGKITNQQSAIANIKPVTF
jgi:flagellar hook-associated protein 2